MVEPILKCLSCNREYQKKKILCPFCKEPGITKLFKYVPYNQFTLSIFINKEVWFPKACNLNDPFEFRFSLSENCINNIQINSGSLADAIRQSMELGVFSLTECNDNILMWSHYADNHRGLCIEFARNENNYLGVEFCVPVIYPDDDKIPIFSTSEITTQKAFSRIATTKSKSWKYEGEWRLVSKEIGDKTYALPGEITGVIFGERMVSSNRKTIRNILKDTVKYYEAKKVQGKYCLEIVPLNV